MTVLRDIVPTPEQLMGVKAVFGSLSSHVLCSAGRGVSGNERQYYALPGGVARRAVLRPFIIAIGGGANVRLGFKGRALNVVRASTVYGDTSTLLDDPTEIQRLAQWPVAVALHDIWRFDDNPRLVEDLGLPDRRVLEGAVDGVIRPESRINALWAALSDWPITLVSVLTPANFIDTGIPTLAKNGVRPTIPGGVGSSEGKKVWKMQLEAERNRSLSREAKRLNASKHGHPTCESCLFSNDDVGMFDAHHPKPLACGERTTLPHHLVVLCPTCHRRAHRRDKLDPYTLLELQAWIDAGRP